MSALLKLRCKLISCARSILPYELYGYHRMLICFTFILCYMITNYNYELHKQIHFTFSKYEPVGNIVTSNYVIDKYCFAVICLTNRDGRAPIDTRHK